MSRPLIVSLPCTVSQTAAGRYAGRFAPVRFRAGQVRAAQVRRQSRRFACASGPRRDRFAPRQVRVRSGSRRAASVARQVRAVAEFAPVRFALGAGHAAGQSPSKFAPVRCASLHRLPGRTRCLHDAGTAPRDGACTRHRYHRRYRYRYSSHTANLARVSRAVRQRSTHRGQELVPRLASDRTRLASWCRKTCAGRSSRCPSDVLRSPR